MDEPVKQSTEIPYENPGVEGNYFTPYNVTRDQSDAEFKIFNSEVQSLPASLRSIMLGFETAEFIEETLGSAKRMSERQKTSLTKLLRALLLSKISLAQIIALTQSQLAIDPSESREIWNLILSDLFSKEALEELKKLQREKFRNMPAVSQPPKDPINYPGQEINKNNIIDLRNQNK